MPELAEEEISQPEHILEELENTSGIRSIDPTLAATIRRDNLTLLLRAIILSGDCLCT